jgi:hypothetical protein
MAAYVDELEQHIPLKSTKVLTWHLQAIQQPIKTVQIL